ncbi:D-inositol-3-phosphate glycosyltransferase [Commensalibacter sp. Nvir]|uniref:glycosyltransferase n=1 Tax=Commensalibacter sp. Nvir TaxID=3069817 RepID=UPI002D4532B5|nr:D-inositol-3-phosphate glycosyltransferase [Commensalibacter sp. Nvir]
MNNSNNLSIAHIMSGAQHGGAELFYERLCIAQYQQGLNILPIIRKNPARKQRLEHMGLEPYEAHFRSQFDFLTRYKIKKKLENFSPDVAVAWMNRAACLLPKGNWVNIGRLGGFYNLKYYKNCDYLVGNTHGIVKWIIQQGWPKNYVHYVPNFARDFPTTLPTRPKIIPKNVPFILALGRLHRNKGFDVLLNALSHINDAYLIIAGEGEERKNLENLITSLNLSHRVSLPGWVNDIAPLIKACDVLVCPSRHEPLGNVVLEGFAAEKPVVAMASQGPKELITHGHNGLLSKMEDEFSMAEAIQLIIKDPAKGAAIAHYGRKHFEEHFSKKAVLNLWKLFFMKVKDNVCAA